MENMKELLTVVDVISQEKGITKEQVIEALCEGIETSLRKNFPEGSKIHVDFDSSNTTLRAWKIYKLVDQVENPEAEMLFNEVEDEEVVDGYVWEEFTFKLTRQQVNITKQVTLQKIKGDARDQQIEELLDKPIQLYMGTVKIIRRDNIIVDCNGLDINIPRAYLLQRDNYKISDKVFFTLEQDRNFYVGTRTSDQYLIEVFKREIVQVEEGEIEIVRCARNPGFRAKVLVKSNKPNLDPVKTCIGMRGVHIKGINNFMNGEIVDIIAYDEDVAKLVINAIAPVNVLSILVDEENKLIELSVGDNEIAQAIGKGGKNIEMVSKIVDWEIKVYSHSQWEQKNRTEVSDLLAMFCKGLNADEELAMVLVENGFLSFEEVAYVSLEEFRGTELDDDTINALKENALEVLGNKEALRQAMGIPSLNKAGFSSDEIEKLHAENVFDDHDLSELSVYDLTDILPEFDTTKAKDIIMKAREKETVNEN